MKIKIEPYIDGKPKEIEVRIYDTISSHGNYWHLVADGNGRHWRIKARYGK